MKPAGYLLLLPAGLARLSGTDADADGRTSAWVSAHIREGLPVYAAPAPNPGGLVTPRDEPTALGDDPDLLVLPKLTVKEPRITSEVRDHLMSRRDFKRKMENIYLDEVAAAGPLNRLLNSFTIPLFSPSKAARGRAIYRQREVDRLSGVIAVTRSVDATAGEQLDEELARAERPPPRLAVIK